MINQVTKDKVELLHQQYIRLVKSKERALYEIAMSELPDMVYNSNAIENSTLTLQDTEAIIIHDKIIQDHEIREIYEAKNLARVRCEEDTSSAAVIVWLSVRRAMSAAAARSVID